MVNGTAESRSHWVTYALGTTATAVVGTKGVGTASKTGAAATKAAVQKSGTTTQNALQSLRTLELPQLLPYTPRLELALSGKVPVNVVDGNQLKDQLMLMAKQNDVKGTKHDGIRIINKKYTGQTYKLSGDLAKKYPSGVNFTTDGFPDFSPYSKAKVTIDGLKGNTSSDFTAANKAMGLKSKPSHYTWHHVEDGRTLMLVPTDLHQAVRHTGGAALIRKSLVP